MSTDYFRSFADMEKFMRTRSDPYQLPQSAFHNIFIFGMKLERTVQELTERVAAQDNKFIEYSNERDLLERMIAERDEEIDRLQALLDGRRT